MPLLLLLFVNGLVITQPCLLSQFMCLPMQSDMQSLTSLAVLSPSHHLSQFVCLPCCCCFSHVQQSITLTPPVSLCVTAMLLQFLTSLAVLPPLHHVSRCVSAMLQFLTSLAILSPSHHLSQFVRHLCCSFSHA